MPTQPTDLSMPRTTFEALSELICLSLNAHCAALFMPESDTTATLTASFSLQSPTLDTSTIAHGRGLVGWILRNKHSLIVNEFDNKHAFLGYYSPRQTPPITAFMGVPFQQGGALCLDRTNGQPFTEDEQALLTRFATYSSFFINASTHQAEHTEGQRFFEGINRLIEARATNMSWPAILKLTLQVLHECTNFEYIAFASLQENDTYMVDAENIPLLLQVNTMSPIPTSQGVVGWVFRNKLPVYTDGNAATPTAPLFGKIADMPHLQTTLCTPIFMEKNLCAVLCLANTEAKSMSPQLRVFIQTVAHYLTQCLEQLNLQHRLRKALPKAQMFHAGATVYDPDSSPSQAPQVDE